ncbi:MAG: IPT/TIG domain-containing protein, partial [bacterium]
MRNQSFISNHCKLSFCKDVSLHLMRLLLLTIILSSGFSIWAAELSSVALTTTPQNAVLIGNPVTLMATATGGTSLQYQFMSGTSLMRSFSSARTFIFTPTVAKTYTLTVIARDISGVDPNATVTSSVVNFAAKPALTAVSLTTTPPNAVLVGTPVTLTATPAGGANVQYQFMTGVSLMRSFASDNTFSFTPTIVRNYTFSVIARDLSAVDPNATVTSSTITFAVKPALTAISLTSLPLKAVLVGKSFTLTATPTGGANVQYKFMTGTSLVRNFASDNTFSFTPTVVRTYSFTVIARDLSGVDPNATVTSSVVNLDVKPALTAVSLTSTPLNAVLVNTPFTLTATPTGGANVQYQFMAGTSLVRSFASDNTFSFTPTVIRSYSFTVFARDLSGDDPNATVTSSVINLDVKPALTAVSLTSAPLNAILVGKPFILTATPTGGANVQYQFMAGTSLVRSFASDNTFSYTPTVVRNYTFTVIARDLSGADPNATVTSSVITLAIRPALTAVSLTTTPLNAALVGAPITLTATVDGGANVQYQFMTGTSLMRNFASDNTFSFTSTAVKTYTFTVIVHDLGGTDPNATVTSSVITLAIRPALTAVSLTTTPLNTTLVGTPVTLTATPAGGVNVQYKFMAGTTQLRSFSTSNSYTFTPATANNYNFSVVASDLGGADPNITFTSATVNYAVTSPLPPTITSFTPASGLIGTVVTITGTNFIGATAVKFNGISAATYTVVSATSITATVPAGATTGNIAVTTAINTATSTTSFIVIPPAPAITSFTPVSGPVGTIVTITGTNLSGTTAVKFNGVTVTTITDNTATTLKAAVPNGSTTGKITVTTAGGTATSAVDFIVMPTITSFTPASGVVGTVVTITGTNLTGTTSVKFNGISSLTITNISATSLTATVPIGATTGKISVTNPDGTANSANDFIVMPAITSFTPISGVVGTIVTITGTNFTGTTSVKFNGTSSLVITNITATSLTATVPIGATTGKISVTNPDGSANSANDFIVMPAITSFTPTSGVVGTIVTITGTNLSGTTAVKFNGVTVTTITENAATTLKAAVPNGATTGKITVTTPGGTATSATDFIVFPTPTISSFTPTTGTFSQVVTINGTNFTGTTAVKFNGTMASAFTVLSATSITATLSNKATTGKITVTTPDGIAASTMNFTVIPNITSFNPINGNMGQAVTITGTNFTDAIAVKFNNIAATYTVDSATSITAVVPTGATTGKITVTTVDGTASSVTDFNVTSSIPMVWVPGGTFTMGSTDGIGRADEKIAHQVTLSGYWMYKYEVTVAQYLEFCTSTSRALPVFPSGFSWANKPTGWNDPTIQQHPIVNVSWNDAKAFADWAGVKLPTEAQWEYAARGPLSSNYPWGGTATVSDLFNSWNSTKCANYYNSFNMGISTWPVGSFLAGASWCGVNDLSGNVGEWCADWYGASYASTPVNNPIGPISGNSRVLRGGSWMGSEDISRCTSRGSSDPNSSDYTLGFRCILTSDTPISFTPSIGITGTIVSITGTNLTGATSVKFNGIAATTFIVAGNTSITAIVPSGVTTGKIVVTTPTGTVTSGTDFTIYQPPTIISFTPTSGSLTQSVTITGTNFIGATDVKFNGISVATFTVNSQTSITTTVPGDAMTGKISIIAPGGTATSVTDFTVYRPPTITNFTPISGVVGTSVTITGTNFSSVTAVKFNSTIVTTFTIYSATSIIAIVPTGATNGKISVTNPDGTANSVGNFIVMPAITSFTPISGVVGTVVTITGTNLAGTTSIKFNGVSSLTITNITATSLTVTVPVGAITGKISVTNPDGTAISTNDFIVMPAITSFTPIRGVVGTVVTITGTNLTGTTSVKFNG